MEELKIVLFNDKKDCCACGACVNVCPKKAISMRDDEYGFRYPMIDYAKCVSCGSCVKVCNYKNPVMNEDKPEVYAAAVKSESLLKKSASGGIFAGIAQAILKDGGAVFGSALLYENNRLAPKHICVKSIDNLYLLQGSKYVQSDIGDTYREAEELLKSGVKVLFSGTPCQISGLNSYLRKKYDNLITIDIICHGVPNAKFFQDYIETLEKKSDISVIGFSFRDKSRGQGMMHSAECIKDGKTHKIIFNGKTKSSYTALFLKSMTYRENCYECPFACNKRCSDITIGDYWGFHHEHPEITDEYGLSNSKGVSCIIANTEKGINCINVLKDEFILLKSDFNKVAKHNAQLNHPSKRSSKREDIMSLYANEGYKAVDRYYKVNFKKYRVKEAIIGMIPKNIKRYIQRH